MSPKTILYVEDNELNRRIVRDLLRRTSYRLLEAPDGETSLDIVRRERPDLILMDIQLPRLSRTLRSEPITANTPIIAITSFALSGDEQRAKEAGATAYMAKPYSPRDLLALIRSLLPESE
jgi:two-component system cell cycle response regulator DivK